MPEAPEMHVLTIGATPESVAENILAELRRRDII